jgi:tRNA pseudouridine38/39 synthase
MSTDYTTWSNTELIERVTALETQLRTQNNLHASSSPPASAQYKKPRKAPKPFDASRYHTRLIALKFAYLGGNYNGFEHHTNNTTPLPTIEEELWRALRKVRLIFPDFKPGRSEDEVEWEGCEYSKCGRTDRGVSAFGQVIGVRVRSNRPKANVPQPVQNEVEDEVAADNAKQSSPQSDAEQKPFDPIADELPYIQLINRVLPPDIRILAWCPSPPADFSARFNCKERRYRYFFTNPAYMPLPGSSAGARRGAEDGWLDIPAMEEAAKKYEGLHDFRNFCKIDASKQITSFERRIFHAGIHKVEGTGSGPELYWFEVRGSAFLWHQVRHLVAVVFLVGQGYEDSSVVDRLLDVEKTPGKPAYDMASDVPLVLWDCIFPSAEKLANGDHGSGEHNATGYVDDMDWVYVGDARGGRDPAKRALPAVEDGKHGRNGIMEELWSLWRKRKMDEVLASSLMAVVAAQGQELAPAQLEAPSGPERSARLFDGSETPRTVGNYIPIAQRKLMEAPDVINARYALRKGLDVDQKPSANADADE